GASALRRSRTPPGRRPRRGRSRRARGSGSRPRARTPPGLPARPGLRLPRGDRHHRPHLDGAVLRARAARRDLERLVECLDLDQIEAAELLLRLGERAVGDQRLAVADTHGRGRRRRLERRAFYRLVADRVAELEVLAEDRVPRLLARYGGLVVVDQEHVLHAVLLRRRVMGKTNGIGE